MSLLLLELTDVGGEPAGGRNGPTSKLFDFALEAAKGSGRMLRGGAAEGLAFVKATVHGKASDRAAVSGGGSSGGGPLRLVMICPPPALDADSSVAELLRCCGTPAAAELKLPLLATHCLSEIRALVAGLREMGHTHVFVMVLSAALSTVPLLRQTVISDVVGAHMVTHSAADAHKALLLATQVSGTGTLCCPLCRCAGLTQLELWHHMPLYHINVTNDDARWDRPACPVCALPCKASQLVDHYQHAHAPNGPLDAGRPRVQLYAFALMVVRRPSDGRFLMVQEYGGQGYWLPGGGIDAGEDPVAGGIRECMEEAGVRIDVKGVLAIRVRPSGSHTKMWYFLYGEPSTSTFATTATAGGVKRKQLAPQPSHAPTQQASTATTTAEAAATDEASSAKSFPDFESVGACWVSIDELHSERLHLRGHEPLEWFPYVHNGGTIYPMDVLQCC